ncbi:MAG TPA: 2-C-methyl-D-erythritol 2,4-cyclodiphosphate synthase [Bacteroidota bacterium]|nr:2-C-methyl-D-erythritol 2,4-cyclodiphosphate synthase [Bacteroidota bacterium]
MISKKIQQNTSGQVNVPRVGIGYDIHQLAAGRKLVLGGVRIPSAKGLLGHSDADVLLHAICDALFGALALGDIGQHFPDTDNAYKNISSLKLLKKVQESVHENGYSIGNIDSVIILETPKLAPYIEPMRKKIATTLHIDSSKISIKATTNERIGCIGRQEGCAAFATVFLFPKATSL